MHNHNERVVRLVISPLEAVYGNLKTEAKQAIIRLVGKFDDKTLTLAVDDVFTTVTEYLKPGHVLSACLKFKPTAAQNNEKRSKQPWDIREEEQGLMVAEYMATFRHTGTYAAAVSGGYGHLIARYVGEVAKIQAQYINPGPSGAGWCTTTTEISDPKQAAVFLKEQRRQAQTGEISVGIPTGLLKKWEKLKQTACN